MAAFFRCLYYNDLPVEAGFVALARPGVNEKRNSRNKARFFRMVSESRNKAKASK